MGVTGTVTDTNPRTVYFQFDKPTAGHDSQGVYPENLEKLEPVTAAQPHPLKDVVESLRTLAEATRAQGEKLLSAADSAENLARELEDTLQ
ncbi:hypothetical protein ACQPZJ_35675 [Actinoplanes sp. CA-054009]